MSVISGILICIAIIGYVIWFFLLRKFSLVKNRIPGPTPIPIFGNLSVVFRGNFENLGIMNHVRKYGDIMRFSLGPFAVVVLEAPEYVKIVTNSPHLLDRPPHARVMDQLIGEGSVLTSSGEKWRKARKAMNESFLTLLTSDTFEAIQKGCAQLMSELKEKSNVGLFQITPVFIRYNLVTMSRVSLAKEQEDYSFLWEFMDFERTFKTVLFRLYSPLHYLHQTFKYTAAGKYFYRTKQVLDRQMSRLLDIAIEERNEIVENELDVPNRFALNLLKSCPNDTYDNLRTHLTAMYGAGVDTTANALTFAVIMLALNDDIQTKLHDEVVRMDQEIYEMKLNDLSRYEYLNLFVKETLRLFPLVPTFIRHSTQDVQFGKYTVPKYTAVVVSLISLHRNEKYFPNPLKFDPERFAPENSHKIQPYTYLPFGLGQRACLGKKFALLSMKVVLIEIVRNFKIYSEYKTFEEMNKNLQGSITLNDKNEGRVRLEKRI